jgi:hypothetical protein
MARYVVREAVLMRTDNGSMWKVIFAPEGGGNGEIEIMVSPARLEQMSFAAPYTQIEIEGIRDSGYA